MKAITWIGEAIKEACQQAGMIERDYIISFYFYLKSMEHKSSHEALVKRSVEESISQPMYTLTIVIADENGNEHQTPLNNLSLYDITQTLGSSVMQAHIANNPYISFNIQKN